MYGWLVSTTPFRIVSSVLMRNEYGSTPIEGLVIAHQALAATEWLEIVSCCVGLVVAPRAPLRTRRKVDRGGSL